LIGRDFLSVHNVLPFKLEFEQSRGEMTDVRRPRTPLGSRLRHARAAPGLDL
jgi:hypothetical protein